MNAFKRISLTAVFALFTLVIVAQKDVPKGWHLWNPRDSGNYFGISLKEAYDFIKSKKLKSTPVIVGVIDSGIDTTHEDLKAVLWRNAGEIAGNGIDDDKNGYIDDVYGWNFLGGRDGRNVDKDSYEASRVYHGLKSKWGKKDIDKAKLTPAEAKEYAMWLRAKEEVGEIDPIVAYNIILIKKSLKDARAADSIFKSKIKEDYTAKDVEGYTPADDITKRGKRNILRLYEQFEIGLEQPASEALNDIAQSLDAEESKLRAAEQAPPAFRAGIVKDNYDDFSDRFYGNGDVMAGKSSALHGTHVSGIIGAVRDNGVGVNGVADNVRIMMVRAVPDGDEHDKDVALAIRYAADNGAKIINMSFGKSYSPEKKWVDEAAKYAQSKGVLLVQAAGNDNKNIDTTYNFPSSLYDDGSRGPEWITVGASGPTTKGLTAYFSNYGKKSVDVFAPGMKIYSTIPGSNYKDEQGTSMASPVVAGLAALIMEYYPNLSARQVKMVIEKSAQKPTIKVKDPGNGEEVEMSDLSRTGGIINAYEAVKLASTLKGERTPDKIVTSTVKPKIRE
ncbi:MAG: S8 family peptidase [Chitinophagales bacterium]